LIFSKSGEFKTPFFPKNPFLHVEIIFFSLKEFENSPTKKTTLPTTVGKELLVAEHQGGIGGPKNPGPEKIQSLVHVSIHRSRFRSSK
jgi:hypothetical protein